MAAKKDMGKGKGKGKPKATKPKVLPVPEKTEGKGLTDNKAANQNQIEILKGKAMVNVGYIVLAKALYENKTKEYYKSHGCETFEEYLGLPEISIGRAMAYDMMRAYKMFVLDFGFKEEEVQKIDVTKVRELMRLDIPNKAEANRWLNKISTLSRSDIISEVQDAQGKTQTHHAKVTECEPAWHVLKMRLEDKKDRDWLLTTNEVSVCECSTTESKNEMREKDILLQGKEYKLVTVVCPKCKNEKLVIVLTMAVTEVVPKEEEKEKTGDDHAESK